MRKSDAVSARAWVHDKLEHQILMGNVASGDALVELRIAEKMGVSRTPVREALRELSREGLVEYLPNRGMFVRAIPAKDVEDVYAIRLMLEEQAVCWAAERMKEEDRAALLEIIAEMEALMREGCSDPRMAVLDTQFHQMIYRFSGSAMLERTLQSLERFILRARSLSLKNRARAEKVVQEHYHIAQALLEGNKDEAVRSMRGHIARAMREVLAALKAEAEENPGKASREPRNSQS